MNCDPIARWYRGLEYLGFGRALERSRLVFLSDVADARRILVLGDGDGRFLVKLVEQNSRASIDYVDVSGKMLELARQRAGNRVQYFQADALTFPLPQAEYDLVVTHFFLDCFNPSDLAVLVHRISKSAQLESRWLISEFRQTAAWSRGLVRMLYLFFRATTGLRTTRLTDHHPLLTGCGFYVTKQQTARFGLLTSELWRRRQ